LARECGRAEGKEMRERGALRPGGPAPLGARPDGAIDRGEEERCPDGERAPGQGEVTIHKRHQAEAIRHGFQRRHVPVLV
jgi:hypothetical protein